MITALLHEITQRGYEVYFNSDFEGMITITYKKEVAPDKEGYIRHEHLSYPGGSMKELDNKVLQSLSQFIEETDNGKKPKKDGLAPKED